MKKTYYFITGLPRSGSTLLSCLLNQNSRFHSEPASPVLSSIQAVEKAFVENYYYRAYPKQQNYYNILNTIIDSYYTDVDKPVVFDKNRGWINSLHNIIYSLQIPNPKIICTVRNIDEILVSFINLIEKNKDLNKLNFIDYYLRSINVEPTIENRCKHILNGVIGRNYFSIKESIKEGSIHKNFIHIIKYDDLVNNTEKTMQDMYSFLEEPCYSHDYNNITNIYKEKDVDVYGLEWMHHVKESIVPSKSHLNLSILPNSILNIVETLKF